MKTNTFFLVFVCLAVFDNQAKATHSVPLYGTVWEEMNIPVHKLGFIGPRIPAWAVYRDDGAGSRGVYALQFSDEAVLEQEASFSVKMPHRWCEETPVKFYADISPEDDTECNYRVCIEYTIANFDSYFPLTSIWCATIPSEKAPTKNQFSQIHSGMSMAEKQIGSHLIGRFWRNSSHVEDTCNGKYMWMHGLGAIYRVDRPGSRQEMIK
jgi:hypothetical protein